MGPHPRVAREEDEMPETPKRFENAVEELMTPVNVGGDDVEDVVIEDVDPEAADAAESEGETETPGLPDWVKVPEGMKFPRGKQVIALRLREEWTDRPDLGERQCLIWNLTEADEKLALRRVGGDSKRTMDELAKQMVRAIDGAKANWRTPGRHNPSTFFTDIGGKGRQALKGIYAKRHTLSTDETIDFFGNCVAVVSVAG